MKSEEGRNFLRSCFSAQETSIDFDAAICYKYGNRKHASDYQNAEIEVRPNRNELNAGYLYVVKCFIHMEIYSAWRMDDIRGEGKGILYRRALEEMEASTDCSYRTVDAGENGEKRVILFRGNDGIRQFISECFY